MKPPLPLLWNEQVAPDEPVPYYALSFDGMAVSRVYATSYQLNLPSVPTSLEADASNELYVVQFFTQPLREFSGAIEEPAVGGTVRGYIPETSRIIEMNDATKSLVDGLEYVRSVTPYHPAYRLKATLSSDQPLSLVHCNDNNGCTTDLYHRHCLRVHQCRFRHRVRRRPVVHQNRLHLQRHRRRPKMPARPPLRRSRPTVLRRPAAVSAAAYSDARQ